MKCRTIMLLIIWFLIGIQTPGYALSKQHLLPSELNTITIFKKISPYVVNIHNLKAVVNPYLDLTELRAGVGSGILLNNEGYIVTNFHVIQGSTKIIVTLDKGISSPAKLVGIDKYHDIALLKITDEKALETIKNLSPLNFANSSELEVGQKAIAIGNPYGLERTLTTGVISAIGRQIPGVNGIYLRDMIQTDASINPGNSGGPLLDSEGDLVGMNTIIYSTSGSSSGIGFAVPANEIKTIIPQLIKYGHIKEQGFGIQILSDQAAKQLGVEGIVIAKVYPGSPAEKAGLKGIYRDEAGHLHLGDIIVAINGTPVKNFEDLQKFFATKSSNTKVTLTLQRAHKIIEEQLPVN